MNIIPIVIIQIAVVASVVCLALSFLLPKRFIELLLESLITPFNYLIKFFIKLVKNSSLFFYSGLFCCLIFLFPPWGIYGYNEILVDFIGFKFILFDPVPDIATGNPKILIDVLICELGAVIALSFSSYTIINKCKKHSGHK